MKSYKTWELNSGGLIVEKFTGKYSLDQVIGPIELILSLAQKNIPLRIFVDLREASVSFPTDDIKQAVEIFVEGSSNFQEIKFAIVTADEVVQEVAFKFSQTSSSFGQLKSMTFHSLNSAFDWLAIKDKDQKRIREILESPK